jgi:ADP-heptose:LPS heptosyltransferase
MTPTQPKKVLIILLGALGDVVRGFTVLSPMKSSFPGVEVTWVVEPKCKGIVTMHPMVDRVVVFEREYWDSVAGRSWIGKISHALKLTWRNARNLLKVGKVLREGEFDLVLDMQRHSKSGMLSWLSGVKKRVGFNRKNAKEFNWIFNTETIDECDNKVSKVLHYQKFLRKIGAIAPEATAPEQEFVEFGLHGLVTVDNIPPLVRDRLGSDTFIGRDSSVGLNRAASTTLVGVVLGSSWESKNLPLMGYVRIIEELLKIRGVVVLLLGDPSQKVIGEQLIEHFAAQDFALRAGADRIVNTAGSTSLKQLVALVGYCKVCVGPDSGPGHISSALKVPYVGLFGPTDPARVAPFDMESLVVKSEIACAPCWKRVCPGLDTLCMRLMPIDRVMVQVRSLLEL